MACRLLVCQCCDLRAFTSRVGRRICRSNLRVVVAVVPQRLVCRSMLGRLTVAHACALAQDRPVGHRGFADLHLLLAGGPLATGAF
eukprot:15253023-Alexandrium_andersonii.AAC.1